MGWFANRRARAAREAGAEGSGAFCGAAGEEEGRGPDAVASVAGGSSATERTNVRGLTRLACGVVALLALSGVLAMEGCAAVSTDAENSAASEQAAAVSASDAEYASFEEVAAAFVAIGREPDTALVRGQVEMDAQGFIVAEEDCRTSVPGVFAAGDARTKRLRQVITAAADGAIAAAQCEKA